jgi:hypothetical protein
MRTPNKLVLLAAWLAVPTVGLAQPPAPQLVLGPGGTQYFNWQINNATGVPNPQPDMNNQISGWSELQAKKLLNPRTGQLSSGNLTWTATSAAGQQYDMSLQTLINPITVGQDTQGAMANFNPNQRYSWPFVSWEGAYTGPTDDFALNATILLDLTNFVNLYTGAFNLHYDGVGKEMDIVYSPVPEPGTLALTAFGLLGVIRLGRRRLPHF